MEEHDPTRTARALTADLKFALDTLVRVVERQSQEFRASVLLVSDDGRHLVDAAAPSLPTEYREAIDGLEIAPVAGSCGTAAHRRERVIVSDIENDPLWAPFLALARTHGLRACWSEPIRSEAGDVLGTFAMYYAEPREPHEADLQIIQAAANRAAAMLDRARAGAERRELVAGLA